MPRRDDDYELLHPSDMPEPDQEAAAPLPCPSCLGVLVGASATCPHCGSYIADEASPARKPWWVVVGVVLCLAVTIYWILP